MNIFWLDGNLSKSAQAYMDSHVRKIILECAQIMSSACYIYGHKVEYKPTHLHHPLVRWACESEYNYEAIRLVAKYLNEEYKFRSKHNCDHMSYLYIKTLPVFKMNNIDHLTKPPLCMPSYCVDKTIVESYRNYYRNEKRNIARWTKRNPPDWWY